MRGLRIVKTWDLTPEQLLVEEGQAPPRVAERLQAVRLIWQGYRVTEVSRIIGRHPKAAPRHPRFLMETPTARTWCVLL